MRLSLLAHIYVRHCEVGAHTGWDGYTFLRKRYSDSYDDWWVEEPCSCSCLNINHRKNRSHILGENMKSALLVPRRTSLCGVYAQAGVAARR